MDAGANHPCGGRRNASDSSVDRPSKAEAPNAVRPSKRTRRTILEAAEQLLGEKGDLDVTVEAIAPRAGTGKQTIYRGRPSKVDLYTELAGHSIRLPNTRSVEGDLLGHAPLDRHFADDLVQELMAGIRARRLTRSKRPNGGARARADAAAPTLLPEGKQLP